MIEITICNRDHNCDKNHNSTTLSSADHVFGKEYYSSEGDMDELNIKEPNKPRSDDRQRLSVHNSQEKSDTSRVCYQCSTAHCTMHYNTGLLHSTIVNRNTSLHCEQSIQLSSQV